MGTGLWARLLKFLTDDEGATQAATRLRTSPQVAASGTLDETSRAPRITMTGLRSAQALLEGPDGEPLPDARVQIVNLSATGIGLTPSGFGAGLPAPGEGLRLRLVMGACQLKMLARVVHVSPSTIGCLFTRRDPEFPSVFGNWFSIELAAIKLRKIDSLLHLGGGTDESESDGKPHLWYGDGNSLFWLESKHERRLIRFKAQILGHCFEGDGSGLTRYWREPAKAKDPTTGITAMDLAPADPKEAIPAHAFELLGRFLERIAALEPWQRQAMLASRPEQRKAS